MEAATARTPRVTIRYFDGCPHWRVAYERLAEALEAEGFVDVHPELEAVPSAEAAEHVRFVGSPTILIDGRDPFDPGRESFGLSCRVYRTPEGLGSSPTVEQLREALRDT